MKKNFVTLQFWLQTDKTNVQSTRKPTRVSVLINGVVLRNSWSINHGDKEMKQNLYKSKIYFVSNNIVSISYILLQLIERQE